MAVINWTTAADIRDPVVREFAIMCERHPTQALIGNLHTCVRFLRVTDTLVMPVTINSTQWSNSYVCSLYTAFVTYAREEAGRKLENRLLRTLLAAIIQPLAVLLKAAQVNQVVMVNNFMFSTNPFPEWDGERLAEIIDFLTSEFPQHAVIFRSLNEGQHNGLLEVFTRNGFRLMATRQVYLYDEPRARFAQHNNNYQDQRLIRRKNLRFVPHGEMRGHLPEAVALYNRLYLEKYSMHNPQFTLDFFYECYDRGLIWFQGYADTAGALRAFSGLFVLGETITSPLVGYDTSAPAHEALYIHAIRPIYEYKYACDKVLNLSSGASKFKRLRGGRPSLEYAAVYTRHLSGFRRAVFAILTTATNRIGATLLKRYEL